MRLAPTIGAARLVWLWLICLATKLCEAAHIKGNPYVTIVVNSARTSTRAPLRSLENVTIWCQAEDAGGSLTIRSAAFIRKRDGQVLNAVLSNDRKRASYHFGLADVADSGNYICKINTTNGLSLNGSHQVFVRPVVFADTGHFEARKDDPFSFDGNGVTVVRGSTAVLSCPVIAFPVARISWTKDGKDFIADNSRVSVNANGVIHIQRVNDSDRGVYECTAKNEYIVNGHTEAHQVMISRIFRVKSELAWLWPIIVIVVILVTLIAIIAFCECRKKKSEQKL